MQCNIDEYILVLWVPAHSFGMPETLILACARKALFRPTQFLALNLHIEAKYPTLIRDCKNPLAATAKLWLNQLNRLVHAMAAK